jgi:hypothetical protein
VAKQKIQRDEDLLDGLLSGTMAGFAMSGPDGRLVMVLKQNDDLRKEHEEVLKRMKNGAPPKTMVTLFDKLMIGDEFIDYDGRRLIKTSWTAAIYLDHGTRADQRGKGKKIIYDSVQLRTRVRKIVEWKGAD